MKRLFFTLIAAATLAACADDDEASFSCERVEVNGSDYCVLRRSAITETGYDCPPDLAFQHMTEDLMVCGAGETLPQEDIERLEDRYGDGWSDGGGGGDVDEDNDGFTADVDCDDTNAAVHPDAEEIPGDGIDNDCDGSTDGLGPVIPTSDYDQSCEVDSDCAVVDGTTCTECPGEFGTGAVNVDEVAAFEAARDAVTCETLDRDYCGGSYAALPQAVCDAGTCRAVLWSTELIAADEAAKSCTADTDCAMAPPAEDVCPVCNCSQTAYNGEAMWAFITEESRVFEDNADVDAITCSPEPPGSCAPCQWQPVCEQGVCTTVDVTGG